MKPFLTTLFLFLALVSQAQVINIPNTAFKRQLLYTYDTDHNGELEQSEALAIRNLYVGCYLVSSGGEFFSYAVSDLTGIEHFTNLERLTIAGTCSGGGGVEYPNLSGLSNLTYLSIGDADRLSKINLTGCIKLDSLIIGGSDYGNPSPLDTLDLNSCTSLRYVNLYFLFHFKKLIVDSCINLKELYLSQMFGESLDLSHLVSLEKLGVTDAYNNINLNCSNLTQLKTVDVITGDLADIQFTGCTNLERVLVDAGTFPSSYLDFSSSPNLTNLILNLYYNPPSQFSNLRLLNLKNGSRLNQFFFSASLNIQQVCADDFEVDTLQQYFINDNQNVNVTSSCSLFPVPVKLEYFSANKKENTNQLNWKASCTYGNAAFVIERSNDGIHFNSIGNINATALRCQLPFNFTDNNPVSGKNYYRLKITDSDGKSFYSKILVVGNSKAGIEIIAVANNTVYFNSSKQQTVQLKLIASDGKEILSQKQNITSGNNSINLQIKNTAKGIYTLIVYTKEGETITKRFMQ
ncbi:MAG: hypothetical protein V4685_11785 [Bacteroidota bacterium]